MASILDLRHSTTGGGMMVPVKSNRQEIGRLERGDDLCLGSTTNVQVLADVFKARNIKYTAQRSKDTETLYKSLDAGQCDAATSINRNLRQRASLVKNPNVLCGLEETMSKEPLTPMVAQTTVNGAMCLTMSSMRQSMRKRQDHVQECRSDEDE